MYIMMCHVLNSRLLSEINNIEHCLKVEAMA